ncbi:PKD domain-containing protein [Arthrobacter cryoconiti]|uniref:PKD domain-containing protein n=1 Tax=Arthrobacter cryoconiti TaxID=748907 RepID=A0ABV8R387_9MICC|nr:PKD domain-containing protein [Arthrobacter cryoconiti]MCC9067015.1 PKD domain-containing protein [Arthrobacter cryoconiti]
MAIGTLSLLLVGLVAPASADTLLPGPAPIEQRSSTTVTSDQLPTVQIDQGVVWTQEVVGNTVFAGGSFSNARPAGAAPGTSLIPRSNILSYDITTGVITSFAPLINGTVKSIKASPDGTRLYVGGTFNSVDGQTRWNLAAFDLPSGTLVPNFQGAVGGSYVNAIAVTDTAVYVGGLIGAGNGVKRQGFAAFNTKGGLLGWAPTSDLQVDAMTLTPQKDKLIVAGRFSQINGVSERGLAALDLTTGALLPWAVTNIVKNGWGTGSNAGKAGIWALSIDQNAVYGTGWVFADATVGNLEGSFSADPATGDVRWIADCHGDHYGVYSDGTTVYTTSHEHACESAGGMVQKQPENMRNASATTAAPKGTLSRSPWVNNIYVDWSGYPAPAVVDWYPDWITGSATGMGQAGFSIVGTGGFISVGGEFVGVNNQRQQGLVRFAAQPPGGAKQGPRISTANWTPSARSVAAGAVRVSIPANWDRDDLNLSYKLMRSGTSTPVATATVQSTYWNMPAVTLSDTGLLAGSTQNYTIVATDPDGNSVTSSPVSVQVSSATASPYVAQVLGDGPSLFWPLGGNASTAAADWVGANNGNVGTGVVSGTGPGAISGDNSPASTFNGTNKGIIGTSNALTVGSSFSTEVWFNTTTNKGGKIVGFGSSANSASSSYDRHVYMLNNGKVTFGTYPGTVKTLTSTAAFNDGQWHHLVAEQGSDGMKLFVDGNLVGSDPQTTTAQSYQGYWRLGGDNLNGWPNQPSSDYFAGSLDNFAVYDTALTPSQVASHYALGTGQGVPTASFTASVVPGTLGIAFDATASTPSAGQTIASYEWDFGDGTNATGVTVTHDYAAAGTYPVVLSVKDAAGVPATTSQSVVVAAPHQPPTAVANHTTTGMTTAFDASASTASDGASISGYAWDFGDSTTSTLVNPTHTYLAPGTFTATLVVTDSTGVASQGVQTAITATHAAPVASFVATPSALVLSVDATGSTASDGASLTYSWDWGDGTPPGASATAQHTYATSGSYTVKLTVQDSMQGSAVAVQAIQVSTQAFIARDDFARTSASGWGASQTGGTWSGTYGLSVAGGTGNIVMAPSQTLKTSLSGVAAINSDSTFTVGTDKVANSTLQLNYGVDSSAAGEYRLKLRFMASGAINVGLGKVVGTAETLLADRPLTGYSQQADQKLQVRFQSVTSGASTTIRAKVWVDGQTEPATWFVTATSSDPTLQVGGTVALKAYLPGATTNGPITLKIGNLAVIPMN